MIKREGGLDENGKNTKICFLTSKARASWPPTSGKRMSGTSRCIARLFLKCDLLGQECKTPHVPDLAWKYVLLPDVGDQPKGLWCSDPGRTTKMTKWRVSPCHAAIGMVTKGMAFWSLTVGSPKTDSVRFKSGFGDGLSKDKFAVFGAYNIRGDFREGD